MNDFQVCDYAYRELEETKDSLARAIQSLDQLSPELAAKIDSIKLQLQATYLELENQQTSLRDVAQQSNLEE